MFNKRKDTLDPDIMVIDWSPEKISAGRRIDICDWVDENELATQLKYFKESLLHDRMALIDNIWEQIEKGKLIQITPIKITHNLDDDEPCPRPTLWIRGDTLAIDRELLDYITLEEAICMWFGRNKSAKVLVFRKRQEYSRTYLRCHIETNHTYR